MKLPRGATGFWHASQECPGTVDARVFRALCHDAARRAGATVTYYTEPGVTPNFHRVDTGASIAVVCHELLPLVALMSEQTFVDDPKWTFDAPFQLLSKEVLDTPVSAADLSELHEVELKQIANWQPETIGQLIFNWWD
ncbi:hypothetical protein FKR81_30025 [Lentzea tibetensis]|uniref:Uncharacterized protein n=1 Tax=Lentzea tibetensis TaxID=2591470 RepID=A0A563EL81_9PSEU|nr:hypothetical protein [Lentzea tibetensis]TWP47918.1 hypothetical protein FKR81_30025 [Lentzea tibetensis]